MKRKVAMKLTDALLGEHAVFYALFDQIETATTATTSVTRLQEITMVLRAVLLSHADLEEDLLFLALEPFMGVDGPLAVMRAEHNEIEQALQQIEDIPDPNDATDAISQALSLIRNHFRKEEEILFAMARQMLDDDTQIRLGKAWADARYVTIG
jgi:hemerythrin-like domain-containing protein